MSTPADLSAAAVPAAMVEAAAETAAAYLSGVDLTGLPPEQALRLGTLVAELLEAAEARGEARGHRKAITALRDEDRYEQWCKDDQATGVGQSWPYWSHAPRFADYLEAIAEEGK